MKRKIYMHIGVPKTGTTTMQVALKKRIPTSLIQEELRSFIATDVFSSANRSPERFGPMCEALLALSAAPESEPIYLSSEGLMGPVFTRGRFFPRMLQLHDMIQYYCQAGYDVRILMVPRRPLDFMQSWYIQTVKAGFCTYSFAEYLEKEVVNPFGWNWVTNLLVKTPAPFTVVPYGLLLKEPARFVERLNQFFEMDDLFTVEDFTSFHNKTVSTRTLDVMRIISQIDDKVLAEQLSMVVRKSIDAEWRNPEGAPSAPPPDIMGPLLRQGLTAALDEDDRAFCETFIEPELRPYYL